MSTTQIADELEKIIREILLRIRWNEGLNRSPDSALEGSDKYTCFAEEFPATIGYGADIESAKQEAEIILKRQLTDALSDPARRNALTKRTVQLNVRILEEHKREIERRANEAGVGLARYIVRCCLQGDAQSSNRLPFFLERMLADVDERLKKLEAEQARVLTT